MTRKLVLLSLGMFLTAGLFSQGFCLGPKIGFSSSSLSTNIPDLTASAKNNFMLGVFVRVGDKIYFQPEVMYTTRGGVFEDSLNLQEDIKFKNLDVPLIIGFKPLNLKVFNLRFMVGPVASFVLDKDIKIDENMADPITEAELKDILWGLDVGLGVDVLFLTLDVRYQFGLNNIYQPAGSGTTYDIRNNFFTVGLGFKLF